MKNVIVFSLIFTSLVQAETKTSFSGPSVAPVVAGVDEATGGATLAVDVTTSPKTWWTAVKENWPTLLGAAAAGGAAYVAYEKNSGSSSSSSSSKKPSLTIKAGGDVNIVTAPKGTIENKTTQVVAAPVAPVAAPIKE